MNEQTKQFMETMKKNFAHINTPEYSGEFAETLEKPVHAPDIERTTPATLATIMQEDAVALDIRKGAAEKIAGAVAVDPEDFTWLANQQKNGRYVLVDDAPGEADAQLVAQKMIGRDFPFVTVLAGGFPAWKDAGKSVEPRK